MGGSRSKERRQLERLEKQKEYHRRHGRGQFQAPDPETVRKNANNNGSFDVYHEDDDKPPSLSPPPPPTLPFASEPGKGPHGTTKQHKVMKKPKHLKRKLLSLNPEQQNQVIQQEAETTNSSSNEVKERERILGELKKWESQKLAHRQNKKTLFKATRNQHDDVAIVKGKTEMSSTPQSSLNTPKKQSSPSKPSIASTTKSDFSRNEKQNDSVKSAASSRENRSQNKKRSIEQQSLQAPTSESPGARDDHVTSSPSPAKEQDSDKVSTRAKQTESSSASAAKDVKMKKISDDEAAAVKKSNVRSSNERDDDDDDDNVLTDDPEKRQRGKRRRGRKDTSKKEDEHREQEVNDNMSKQQQENLKEKDAASSEDAVMDEKEKERNELLLNSEKKKQRKENDGQQQRYCIGRKPMTDFIIGQTYPGKIVYMKPFGVFFDLGCHKDAFCHVSRLQDDYVESPESLFQVGDVVEHCRVVEIDRKQQRITVSLQSMARIQDERASVEARKGRQNKRKKSSSSSSSSFAHQGSPHKQKKMSDLVEKNDATPAAPPSASVGNVTVKNSIGAINSHVAIKNKPPPSPLPPHVGMGQGPAGQQDAVGLTPAEQKRERKLARRAARRAEKEAKH